MEKRERYMLTHIQAHAHTQIPTCTQARTHIHACAHTHMHACMRTHTMERNEWWVHKSVISDPICVQWVNPIPLQLCSGGVTAQLDADWDDVSCGGVLWADWLRGLLCLLLLRPWVWGGQPQLHPAQRCAHRLQDRGVPVRWLCLAQDAAAPTKSLLHDFGYLPKTVSILVPS